MNNKPQAEQKIFDSTNSRNVGILLMREETLQEIADNSGPLAKRNEFQVHYWALVVRRIYGDGSIVDLAFPTVFFNYAQQVSPVRIDFELKDVEDMSISVKPLHDQLAQNIVEQLALDAQPKSVAVEYLSVPMNTLHRHPTGVSSFSGTDLAKNHIEETGIVFPLAEANLTSSFSCIMYNNPVKLIRAEYRLATGSTANAGIIYEKGRSATLYVPKPVSPDSISTAESIFLSKEIVSSNVPVVIPNGINEIPQDMIDFMLKATSIPNTMFITADNVSEKKSTLKTGLTEYWEDIQCLDIATNNDSMVTFDSYLLEDSETIEILEKMYDVKYQTDEELSKCSKLLLLSAIVKFSEQYYGKVPTANEMEEYTSESKEDLADVVSELQYLFYEENRAINH